MLKFYYSKKPGFYRYLTLFHINLIKVHPYFFHLYLNNFLELDIYSIIKPHF